MYLLKNIKLESRKGKMRNRIVALALTLVILLSSVSVFAFAAENKAVDFGEIAISFKTDADEPVEENIKDKLKYSGSTGIADYFYRDSYFLSSSNRYNEHLATLSFVVSMSACSDSGNLYVDEYRNAEYLFTDMGFDTIEANTETDSAKTPETMGVVLAKKNIIDGTEPCTLVAIAFRSGGYGSEWVNNFIVGSTDECPEGHLGFHNARDRSLQFILDYLDRNVEGNTKLWITGFSRGGAISGLTGAWFNDNIELLSEYDITLDKEDVFTYTFEAPASIDSELNKQKNYDNIFNIISPNDIVPLVPFSAWGLECPGKKHYLPDFTGDNVDKIIQILSDLNGGIDYDIHKFEPYMFGVGETFAEFISNLCDIFASRIDRNTYADRLENTLSRILDKLLNSSDAEMELLVDTFTENILMDLGVESNGDTESGIVSLIFGLVQGEHDAIDRVSAAIGKNLAESHFIEVCDKETVDALNMLLDIILYRGDGVSLVSYALTVLKYPNLMVGHTPEIILAAMMYEDSYYSNSDSVLWSSGHMSNDNTVTVSVNDGKRVYSVDFNNGSTVTADAEATGCVEFKGWYVNNRLVTDKSELTFVADKNISIRAAGEVVHKELGVWSVDTPAVVFFEGSMSRECSACGAKYVEILPAPLGLNNPWTYAAISGVTAGVLIVATVASVIVRKRKKLGKKQAKENIDN